MWQLYLILPVLFSIVLPSTPAFASDSENVSLLGRWTEGPCLGLETVDGIAYFGNGAILEIVDFQNHFDNILLSRVPVPGPVLGVSVAGGLACVANGTGGLRVIGVSDPAQAFEIGFSVIAGCVEEVVHSGSHAYLAAGEAGLRVVDISDPASPIEVGFLDTPGYADDIILTGNVAFLADGNTLRIIDVVNAGNPVEIGFFSMPSGSEKIAGLDAVGNHAYVVTEAGLRIIDVSDPAVPWEVGFLDTFNTAFDVCVSDAHAFVTAGTAGLRVIDVSDPAAPSEISNVNPEERIYGVEISDQRAYAASGSDGLTVFYVASPEAPYRTENWDTHGYSNIAVGAGDFVYSQIGEKLHILNVSNPGAPEVSGYFIPNTPAYNIVLEGSYAYVVCGNPDLRIFDLSNPAVPVDMSSLLVGGYWVALDIAVNGDYAYLPLAGGHSYTGMQIVDISDPASPFALGYLDTSAPRCVVAGDGFAYLGDWDALWIVDATDPENPQVASTLAMPGIVEDIALDGEHVYLACSEAGLRIVDVSDPFVPSEVGFWDTPGHATGVELGNHTAYVADGTAGLRVIDVRDPAVPVEVGFYDTYDVASYVHLDSGRIYVADGNDGLYILRNDLLSTAPESDTPTVTRLQGVYPNPFNPLVSVNFSLSRPQQVSIAVFDLTGSQIAVIADRMFPTGTHAVRWNGRDAAGRTSSSGVYVVRMDAAGLSESRKVTLVR